MSEQIKDAANNIIRIGDKFEKETFRYRKLFLLNQILLEIEKIENVFAKKKEHTVSWTERKRLLRELRIDPVHLEEAMEHKDIKEFYNGSMYGKIANFFFEPITKKVMHIFPQFTDRMHQQLMSSGMQILSNTYLSMLLFTSFLLLFVGSSLGVVIFYATSYAAGFFLGFVLAIISMLAFSLYPVYATMQRKKDLKKEYPFIVTHLAAIASTDIRSLPMFKALMKTKYSKSILLDANRVVNYVTIFGYSLPDSLKMTAANVPAKEICDLLIELAQKIDAGEDVKSYLNRKARTLIAKYRTKKAQKLLGYTNAYRETATVMKQLHFKGIYGLAILIATSIIVLDILYLTNGIFLPVLIGAVCIGWSPVVIDTYRSFEKNRKMEVEFFHFVHDLKKTQSLLKITKTYGTLDHYVKKLINQYRISIPLEQAMETFALDTENMLIQGAVATALETKKHGANIFDALDQVTTSKMTRHVLILRV